ncbi:C-C motif chemokine 4 [Microcaecilia unicolor]|uniref:C-C motif chemokine n=1 Tax=Microcaecilia unicolor TaxID=1415580 RepID=A0A6P7WMD3_9AMPH|nr:C-C motif chemokine 4-like [Microcaecilia unicolor]
MKLCLTVLCVTLLAAFCSQVLSAPAGSDPTSCCFSYASRQIPRKHVREYYYTSSRCTQPAVIFVTWRNREICANPETKWVQDHVNYLEMNSKQLKPSNI